MRPTETREDKHLRRELGSDSRQPDASVERRTVVSASKIFERNDGARARAPPPNRVSNRAITQSANPHAAMSATSRPTSRATTVACDIIRDEPEVAREPEGDQRRAHPLARAHGVAYREVLVVHARVETSRLEDAAGVGVVAVERRGGVVERSRAGAMVGVHEALARGHGRPSNERARCRRLKALCLFCDIPAGESRAAATARESLGLN